MSAVYFWDGKDAITVKRVMTMGDAHNNGYVGMLCVDNYCTSDAQRYGIFVKDTGWVHVPYSEFPSFFKAWLLINS